LPADEPARDLRPYIDFGGWQYVVDKGQLLYKRKSLTPWADLKTILAAIPPGVKPVEWHTKFVIFNAVSILDRGSDGVLRLRRARIVGPQLRQSLATIALFGAMVQAYSGGHARMVPDVSIEEDTIHAKAADDPMGESFAKDYFKPRINRGKFEAEDRAYHGPYESVFYIHPGLIQNIPQTEVAGSPVTGLPFYLLYDEAHPGALAQEMFHGWLRHLAFAAKRHGFIVCDNYRPERLQSDPADIVTPDMWAEISRLETNGFENNMPPRAAIVRQKFEEVRGDIWQKLPVLTNDSLSAFEGVPVFIPSNGVPVFSVDAGSKQLWFVYRPFSELFAAHIGHSAAVLGIVHPDNEGAIVFKTDKVPESNKSIDQVLGVATQSPPSRPARLTLSYKDASPSVRVTGGYQIKGIPDPERGMVAQVTENTWARSGIVELVGGGEAFDASKARYLEFWIKPLAPRPLTLQIAGVEWSKEVALFGMLPKPEGTADNFPSKNILQIEPIAKWQHVIVDLGAPADHPYATAVLLSAGPYGADWELGRDKALEVLLDDVKMSDAPSGPLTPMSEYTPPSANATGADPGQRELFAATATAGSPALAALLKDPNELVALNAAEAYTRIADPKSEPGLMSLSRSVSSELAFAAMRALARQNTDRAWAAIVDALKMGPFDHNREAAALVLTPEHDSGFAPDLALTFGSKVWTAQLAAVHALSHDTTSAAQLVLLTFIHVPDPQVRMAVAELADIKSRNVEKEVMWNAVNDPFDAVRLACCIDLVRSGVEDERAEGYKGLNDDSIGVRIRLLEYLKAHPEQIRQKAVDASLADDHPEVQSAALDALGSVPGPVNVDELGSVLVSRDPRVQRSLLDLLQTKSIKAPQQSIELMRNSADPAIAARAAKLAS
jgi:HEAT repeat protein